MAQAATDDFESGRYVVFSEGAWTRAAEYRQRRGALYFGFDDGHFSEFGTFSITDWVGRTSPRGVQRNLGLPAETVAEAAEKGALHSSREDSPAVPGALPGDRSGDGAVVAQVPAGERCRRSIFPGGWERIVSSKEFPIQTTLTAVLQYLEPGSFREMHWHPNADEWQYYLSGALAGDHLWRAWPRENGGVQPRGRFASSRRASGITSSRWATEPTKFVILFNSPVFEEISISKWLAGNPASLIADNFCGISAADVAKLPKKTLGIIQVGDASAELASDDAGRQS